MWYFHVNHLAFTSLKFVRNVVGQRIAAPCPTPVGRMADAFGKASAAHQGSISSDADAGICCTRTCLCVSEVEHHIDELGQRLTRPRHVECRYMEVLLGLVLFCEQQIKCSVL